MVVCCEKERNTCFCPDCGAQLNTKAANLNGLIAHLRSHIKSQETGLENMKARRISNDESRLDEWLERRQRSINKWHSWLDAVLALVEESNGGEEMT